MSLKIGLSSGDGGVINRHAAVGDALGGIASAVQYPTEYKIRATRYLLSASLSLGAGCAGSFSFPVCSCSLARFRCSLDLPSRCFLDMKGWFPHQSYVHNETHVSRFGHLTIRPQNITLASRELKQ